jgi:hypothetical protein
VRLPDVDELDRTLDAEVGLPGTPDDAHAAAPDLLDELVTIGYDMLAGGNEHGRPRIRMRRESSGAMRYKRPIYGDPSSPRR